METGIEQAKVTLNKCKEDVKRKVHSVIDSYAERGLRSLAVAKQEVPEKTKESPGRPWNFVGLLPLFDPLRLDSAETIRRALHLGVNVKMITDVIGVQNNVSPTMRIRRKINNEIIPKHHITIADESIAGYG